MSWEIRKFGDVVEFPPKVKLEKKEQYSFIPMDEVEAGRKYVGPQYLKEWKGSGGARFQEGDTLFARITPCLQNGKIAQAKGLINGKGFGSTEFFIFRGIEGVTDTDFVYYLSINSEFSEYAIGSMVGASGRQRADTKFVGEYEFNLPPLQTQKRIAGILSAYDDLIENNLKRIKLLEQAAQNIYKEWFVNMRFPGHENAIINQETGLPKGWEKTKLGELVSLQQGFALNKKSRHHISEEVTKYPLLKISDLFKGIESLFVKDTIPKQFLVDKHEIIFSRTGQVGHAFMGRKGVVYNNCFRVTPKDKIDSLFLYQTLIEPQFVGYVKGLATGAAQPDLNHGAFKSIEIVLPPRKLQDKFSILKEGNQTLKFNLLEQNKKLKAARDILLPRLMNRTIEV